MELELLAKDKNSGNFGCQTVYLARGGGLVVHADFVDDVTHGRLQNALPGEQAVSLDESIVRDAMRALGWL